MLFDAVACHETARELETITELRPAVPFSYFFRGPRLQENVEIWAAELASLFHAAAGGNKRLAVDRLDIASASALTRHGITLMDAQGLIERSIKSAEEILCMNYSLVVANIAMARMRETLRPGLTENELFAILYHTNIAMAIAAAASRPRSTSSCSINSARRHHPLRCVDGRVGQGCVVADRNRLKRIHCPTVGEPGSCDIRPPSTSNHLAGDEAGVVGGEERDDLRHLVRLSDAPDRVHCVEHRPDAVRCVGQRHGIAQHRRVDRPGATPLTRTPCRASSTAIAVTRPIMPCLATE